MSAGRLQEIPQERWRKDREVYLLTFPREEMADPTQVRTSFTARNRHLCLEEMERTGGGVLGGPNLWHLGIFQDPCRMIDDTSSVVIRCVR